MRTITSSTKNFTKVDLINSKSGVALKDEEMVTVSKLAVIHDDGAEKGEDPKDIGVIVTDEGKTVTCISTGAIETIFESIELVDEGMKFHYLVDIRTSKSGNEFITLSLIPD